MRPRDLPGPRPRGGPRRRDDLHLVPLTGDGDTLPGSSDAQAVTLYEVAPDKSQKGKRVSPGLTDLRLIRPLANGKVLLALAAPHKVVEVDAAGAASCALGCGTGALPGQMNLSAATWKMAASFFATGSLRARKSFSQSDTREGRTGLSAPSMAPDSLWERPSASRRFLSHLPGVNLASILLEKSVLANSMVGSDSVTRTRGD